MRKVEIAVLDITGRTGTYDDYLCNALSKFIDIKLFSPNCRKREYFNSYPTFKFISINSRVRVISIILKAVCGVINYSLFGILLCIKRFKIVHIQWLPYLEKSNLEKHFLSLYHFLSPKTKFVFTIHNVYPHNSDEQKKQHYRERFKRIEPYIDHYMVHTESTKKVVSKEFSIAPDSISVVFHGTFVQANIPATSKRNDNRIRVLMYGNQSYYKGTDIFVKASIELIKKFGEKVSIHVLGMTSKELMDEYYELATRAGIKWIPTFIENDVLNQEIVDSDVLVFPYRAISQSGALLMAFPFRKPIILTNLPSFVETMGDYPLSCFVDVDSVDSLYKALSCFVEGHISFDKIKYKIDILNKRYNWEESAKKLCRVYDSL